MHRLERAIEAGALAVEPIEGDEARQFELFGHRPHLFGGDFHAGNGIDDDHGGVGDAQRGARLAEEVPHAG